VSTLESKVIGVLARAPHGRTIPQIHEHLPGFGRDDVRFAVMRLVADGAIERVGFDGSHEQWRLMYVPEADWSGIHVNLTLAGVTLAIVGMGFLLLAAVILWGAP